MSLPTLRAGRQICRPALNRSFSVNPLAGAFVAAHPSRPAQTSVRRRIQQKVWQRCYATAPSPAPAAPTAPATPAEAQPSPAERKALPDLQKLLLVVEQAKKRFLSAGGIPSPQLTLVALKTFQTAALAIRPHLRLRDIGITPSSSSASSNLLALDNNGARQGKKVSSPQKAEPSRVKATARQISEAAYDIVASPNVVITPQILALYVDIQAELGHPETIPDVFSLFASKPLPKKSRSGIMMYKKQNPNRAAAAIELEVAEKALSAAMAAKDLDAAIGIVEACYTGKPFLKQKVLRTASVPALATVAAPFAIYAVATQFANSHYNVDPAAATKITFAAGMTYLVFTTSLGLIAKATAADHMVRVTWAPGVPLRDRWAREDERMALDKIAMSWGFKETWRHGEEAGIEWASLREYIGQKGMILDRVEFMDGMN